MFNKRNRQEKSQVSSRNWNSGQAIILIALAAVGLIAIMGLSIDGGRLFVLKRQVQEAADAAALAGARAACLGDTGFAQIAKDAAVANGLSESQVTVNTPPQHSSIAISSQCTGCFLEVVVNAQIPGTFISMFYKDPLSVSSTSVAVCNPYMYDTNGDGKADYVNQAANPPGLRALWAMGTGSNACGIKVSGSVAALIGGYHTNSTGQFTGNSMTVVGPASYVWEHTYPIKDSSVTYVTGGLVPAIPSQTILGACAETCFKCSADTSLGKGKCGCNNDCVPGSYPWEEPYHLCAPVTPDPLNLKIADYGPGGAKAVAAGANYHRFTGTCSDTNIKNWFQSFMSNGSLQPGLYYTTCSIHFPSSFNLAGTATIVTTSDIQISGGASLTAWQDNLLFFAGAGGNTCTGGSTNGVQISGNNNSYTGNIYAPAGLIKFSGASSTLNGCAVGWGAEFTGSNSTINCNPTFGVVANNPGIWLAE